MDNKIQAFDFNERAVRCIMKDGEPWWVAKDVCDVLGIGNPSEALRGLDDDERSTLRISEGTSPTGGNPNMNIISESGLYTLILRSNKPEARSFRRWVTHEVLPTLRKTGHYSIDENLMRLIKLSRGNVSKAFMERLVSKAAGFSEVHADLPEERRGDPKLEALILRFVEEECEQAPEKKVSRQDFYRAFQRWCVRERVRPLPTRSLTTRAINAASLFPVSMSRGVRFWVGVHVEHA